MTITGCRNNQLPMPDQGQIWFDKTSDFDAEIVGTYAGAGGILRIEFIKKGSWNDLDIDSFRDNYSAYTPMKWANKGADEYWGVKHNYGDTIKDYVKCDCGGLKTYGNMEPEYHSTWCKSRR